jgi:hypothetical protein
MHNNSQHHSLQWTCNRISVVFAEFPRIHWFILVFISAYERKYHVQITETEVNLPLVIVPQIFFY